MKTKEVTNSKEKHQVTIGWAKMIDNQVCKDKNSATKMFTNFHLHWLSLSRKE
jgi:hypothetical protein